MGLQCRLGRAAIPSQARLCGELPQYPVSYGIRTWGRSRSPPGWGRQGEGRQCCLCGQPPSSACSVGGEGASSHNQLCKGILAPWEKEPQGREINIPFCSMSSQAPTEPAALLREQSSSDRHHGAGDWQSQGPSPACLRNVGNAMLVLLPSTTFCILKK